MWPKGAIPIATFRWRGNGAGTKTAWDDGRNWVNEAGAAYAQGVYPGVNNDAYDDVVLDAAVAAAANALAGYDASGKNIHSFRVSNAYNQNVASSGTYLQIDAVEVIIDSGSTSTVYLYANTVTNCTVTADGTVYVKGTFGTLTLLKGIIQADATFTVSTTLTIGYVTSVSSDVTLTLPAVTSLPATVNAQGGTVTCSKAITTLNINGSNWTQVTGDIATLNVISGTFNWTDGNITTAYLYGGTLDASGGAAPRRIGTAIVYPTAACLLDNGQDNILVTTYVQNFGGTASYGAGYTEAPYPTKTHAGAADANIGIAPQTINNSNVYSTAIQVGPHDRLEVYCITGAMHDDAIVIFHAEDSATSAGVYVDLDPAKTETFGGTDDNQTRKITVWGYEMNASKLWVKINVAESGTENAIIACVLVKSTF